MSTTRRALFRDGPIVGAARKEHPMHTSPTVPATHPHPPDELRDTVLTALAAAFQYGMTSATPGITAERRLAAWETDMLATHRLLVAVGVVPS